MDWIKARFGCSLIHAWNTFREQINADVTQFRGLQKANGFPIVEVSGDESFVSVTTSNPLNDQHIWIRASPDGDAILVKRPSDQTAMRFIPTLNAKGECRLRHNDDELEFWQASRRVLEPLLFG